MSLNKNIPNKERIINVKKEENDLKKGSRKDYGNSKFIPTTKRSYYSYY